MARAEAAGGFDKLRGYAREKARQLGIQNVRFNAAGCLDRCEFGPNMVIYPEGTWYRFESQSDIDEILETHLKNGDRVERLMLQPDPAAAEALNSAAAPRHDFSLRRPRRGEIVSRGGGRWVRRQLSAAASAASPMMPGPSRIDRMFGFVRSASRQPAAPGTASNLSRTSTKSWRLISRTAAGLSG